MTKSDNVVWHGHSVNRDARQQATGGPGATLWLTGLSGSGKSTVGVAVEAALIEQGRAAFVLDGDNVRHGLNGDLGFSEADRRENIRRVSHVAHLLAQAGLVAIVTLISPYRADRDLARSIHESDEVPFFEVFVNTPLEVCEERDPKGLYARARAGEIKDFTGLDAPYEEPVDADLEVDYKEDFEHSVRMVLELIGVRPVR